MAELQATVRITVHEGTLHDFEGIARKMVETARDVDSGTLRYDWFSDAEETEFVVRAIYRDSDAVLEHIANLGDTLKTFQALCSVDIQIFGAPSENLRAGALKLGARIYDPFLSL